GRAGVRREGEKPIESIAHRPGLVGPAGELSGVVDALDQGLFRSLTLSYCLLYLQCSSLINPIARFEVALVVKRSPDIDRPFDGAHNGLELRRRAITQELR